MSVIDLTKETDVIAMRDVLLEKVKVAAGHTIGAATLHDMRLSADMEPIANQLYVTLTTSVLAQKLCEDKYEVSDQKNVEVPFGAWQMFKRDHMPKWFVKKFPVRYRYIPVHFHKTIEITRRATYPQSNMVIQGDRELMKVMGPMVIRDEVTGK
jgi:hypothetical protein